MTDMFSFTARATYPQHREKVQVSLGCRAQPRTTKPVIPFAHSMGAMIPMGMSVNMKRETHWFEMQKRKSPNPPGISQRNLT